jgi:subtilisin-like proprotein convertase family protein
VFKWLLRPTIVLFVVGTSSTLIAQDVQVFQTLNPTETQSLEAMAPAAVHSSGNLALPVLDPGTTTSTLSVPALGTVVDVNLRVRLDHPRVNDLDIHLISPDGTTVEIATDVGQFGVDFGSGAASCAGVFAQFDDEGTSSVLMSAAPFIGVNRPEGSLAAFKGRAAGGTWTLRITDDSATSAGTLFCWELVLRRTNTAGDFTGTARSELAVVRAAGTSWFTREVCIEFISSTTYVPSGWLSTDIPVMGDYNGNGADEPAVFRPSTGEWRTFSSMTVVPWGTNGDVPVPGDYNADGVTDIAVWRPADGVWHVRNQFSTPWGGAGDIPVPGDYNGDGATDLAVWRPSTGFWYVASVAAFAWGAAGDIPVPADYDGDLRTDFGVYRPSTGQWFIVSLTGIVNVVGWGGSGDIPVPADYDADGKADFAVWRPSNQTYYIRNVGVAQWGAAGDMPAQKRPAYPGYPY